MTKKDFHKYSIMTLYVESFKIVLHIKLLKYFEIEVLYTGC